MFSISLHVNHFLVFMQIDKPKRLAKEYFNVVQKAIHGKLRMT